MKKQPKISVIIPVYNSEKYLSSTLSSVTNQTFPDLEIICINDCSTDNSLTLLNKLASQDDRIVIYDNPRNMGVSLSRNRGIEKATGEYITFLDNDDSIEPTMYETLYQEATKGNYDMVKCDVFIHSDGKVTSPVYELNLTGKALRDKLISLLLYQLKKDNLPTGLWMSGVWNRLYKREFIHKNQITFLSEREYSYEDLLFNLSVLLKTVNVQIINKPLYHYNYHPGSLGGAYIYLRYPSIMRTFQLAEDKLQEAGISDPDITNRLYYSICNNIPVCTLNELKRNPQGKKGAIKEIYTIFMHPLTRKAVYRIKLRHLVYPSDGVLYKICTRIILRSLWVLHLFTIKKNDVI